MQIRVKKGGFHNIGATICTRQESWCLQNAENLAIRSNQYIKTLYTD